MSRSGTAALQGQAEAERTLLTASRAHCHEVARARARNFYYGMKLTPEPKRSAMYAIYAWMRRADDLADEAGGDEAKVANLEAFRRRTHEAIESRTIVADDPMWPAVQKALVDYQIPAQYLDDMIAGQLLDQHKVRYQTFEELYDYCYKVASTVGLVCIRIWGCQDDEETRHMAEQRGVALQLTNILRDLAEDAARGRIYLPTEEMEAFGFDPADLAARRPGPAFDRLMAFQIERARRYYEGSKALERRLTSNCRATSWAMMRIYRGLLEKVAADPRQVLQRRISLNRIHKLLIALRATLWL